MIGVSTLIGVQGTLSTGKTKLHRQSPFLQPKNFKNRFVAVASLLFCLCFPFVQCLKAIGGAPVFKVSLQAQDGNVIVSWPSGVTTKQVQIQSSMSPSGP